MRVSAGIYLLLAAIATEVSCDCGLIATGANPSDFGEDGIGAEIFPWRATIYASIIHSLPVRLGYATFITSDVVITAFRNIDRNRTSSMYVVTGNYTPFVISHENTIPKTRVVAIHVAKGYDGWGSNRGGDVAWLVLEHPLNVTPACIDLENPQDTAQLPIGLVGQIFYENSLGPWDRAQIRRMEVIDSSHSRCLEAFPEEKRHNMSPNPSCARLSAQIGFTKDHRRSGFFTQHNGRWYLRAIITDTVLWTEQDTSDSRSTSLMMTVQHFADQILRSGAIRSTVFIIVFSVGFLVAMAMIKFVAHTCK